MDFLDLIASDNYIPYNRTLAKCIGLENAILFGALCGYQRHYKQQEFYREQEAIMEDTCLTEYAVRKSIKELREYGLISVVKKGLPAKYYYQINTTTLIEMLSTSGCENDTTRSDENTTSINKIKNKNEDKINNKEKNITKKEIECEFEELWNIYPNKQGKTNAIKSFEKARNKGVEFETIKKGLENYIKYCQEKKMEKQYIKHGSTWFNQECWNDEYNLKGDTNGDRVKLPDWITVY